MTDLDKRVEASDDMHKRGFNCCQSVVCSYTDLLGVDQVDIFKVSEGFGLGMGMMETCGAVTGMIMVAGLYNSAGDLEHGKTKPQTMKLVKELTDEFLAKNGSLKCRELKGVDTGVVLRSCPGCIEDGIRIVGEKIFGLE